jgi:carboxyl-terminal processing protease
MVSANNTNKGLSLRTLLLLLCFPLVVAAPRTAAQQVASPADKGAPKVAFESADGLSLASTNDHYIADVRHKPAASLKFDPDNNIVAQLTAEMLMKQHYLGLPLNDAVSGKFLDRYIETLDNLHLHFLQADLEEFDKYRTLLDDLTVKRGDATPGRVIFKRFLERLEERVGYVQELLANELFTFTGDDRYNLNRKEAPRPKDMAEAKQLWRQHLRYEILQEKLAKEKPDEIAKKISRRYARLLRTFKDLDGQDIFEIYLSALTHVYDPHSDYMSGASLANFNVSMALSLFGIGALLQSEDGYCKIKELKPGPALRSQKLKENDRIIAVAQGDGEPVDVVDMKLSKVVELIRGPKGTEVRLTIIPADAPDPSTRKVVKLIRDEIKLEDQEAKAKIIDFPTEDGKTVRLGVIDLPSFYADFDDRRKESERKSTTTDVKKLLRKLVQEKVGGVILNLRQNGGGSLEEAINLTGLFIKEGPVVQVRDPNNKVSIDEDTDPSMVYGGPLIVLTSRFSASASEILAGALQDYGRAVIVGDSATHGKGTVQSLIRLDPYTRPFSRSTNNPGAVKLTIRKFYRASGSSTQLKGVTPDLVLPSVNNYAEVGESSLENPLPWDTIRSAPFEKLNLVQPLLAELKSRSDKRLGNDKDFEYIREDIEQYKKALADKTVSLNEAKRLKERDEIEARRKARLAELKSRKESEEKVYEITLRLTDQPGLPDPVSKTNTLAKANLNGEPHKSAEGTPATSDGDDDEADEDLQVSPIDVPLKEAKRILVDLIELSHSTAAVAKSSGAARVAVD